MKRLSYIKASPILWLVDILFKKYLAGFFLCFCVLLMCMPGYGVELSPNSSEISAGDKVLEIGTGCGYQAAILSKVAKKVYTIEIIPQLATRARRTLTKLGYQNVEVKTGDGYQGWAEYAPYDAIIVTAAPERIPQPLIDQLAINGKMVIPVGKLFQEIVVLTKTQEGVVEEITIPVRFVPMRRKALE